MNDMNQDMTRVQELVGNAFSQTGSLVALANGGQMNPNKLQKTLEQTMEQFENAALELRRLCEQYSPGVGGFAKKNYLPAIDVTGSVEEFGYGWLHITLNTLLPADIRVPTGSAIPSAGFWMVTRRAEKNCRFTVTPCW